MLDNRPLSEMYAQAGEEWADLEAAASLKEETRSAFKAELIVRALASNSDLAHNKAETFVLASPEWREFVLDMVECRRKANRAKITREVVMMRSWEETNRSANERMAARL